MWRKLGEMEMEEMGRFGKLTRVDEEKNFQSLYENGRKE